MPSLTQFITTALMVYSVRRSERFSSLSSSSGIKGVFHRHGTRDAAHIHVGFHGAAVGAALDLALVLSRQVLGLIFKDVLAAGVADLFHSIQQQVGDHIDLVVDGAEVAGEGVAGREHIPG